MVKSILSNDIDQYVFVNEKKVKVDQDKLYLSNRNIGEISNIKGLVSLTNIKELYLNNSNITKISNLEHLINLEHLELSMNNIKDIEGLDSIVNLKVLNLSQNKIQKISGLDSLVNLRTLNIGQNFIKKIEGLDKLVNLDQLTLIENEITQIQNLGRLKHLKTLNLDYNRIFKISKLYKLTALKTLGLSGNRISKIENLQKLTNLNLLNLAKNKITVIKGLKNNIKLKILILYMNFIGGVEGLEKLTDLEELSLFGNNIKEISNLSILKKLKKLSLMNNSISNMSGIEELDNLEDLELVSNQISEISSLEKIKGLKYLWLGNNQIAKIEGLNELINLQYLNLNYNEISHINDLTYLKKLKNLDLSNNNIKKIEGIDKLENLETLHLKNNKIRSVKGLPRHHKLRELDIRENRIEDSRNFIYLHSLQIRLLRLDLYRMKYFNGIAIDIIHRFLDEMINQYQFFYSPYKDRTEVSYFEVNKEHLDDILCAYNIKLSLTINSDERRKIQSELQNYLTQRIKLELKDSKKKYFYTGLKKLVSSLSDVNKSRKLDLLIKAKKEFEKTGNKKVITKYNFALKVILLIKSADKKENFNVLDLIYDLINSNNIIDDINISEFRASLFRDTEFIDPIVHRIISLIIEENRTYYLNYKSPERFKELLKDMSPQMRKMLENLKIEEIDLGLEKKIIDLTTLKLYFAQMDLRIAYYDSTTGEFYQNEISYIKQQIEDQLEKAIKVDSNFVIFPEYAFPKSIINDLIQFSKDQNIWIVGGCERFESKKYDFDKAENVVFIISPKYPPIIQKKRVRGKSEPPLNPGNNIKIIHSEFGTFTILICADFLVEYLLLLISEQVDFIIVPSFNKDVDTFKRKALDKCINNCCFIFINNITQYPDSRIFAPYKGKSKEVKMLTFPFFKINFTEFTQHRRHISISKKFKLPLSYTFYNYT